MKDPTSASPEPEPARAADDAEPVDIEPMLASLGKVEAVARKEKDWAFEMKWDGIRAIATVRAATKDSDGSVTLTRHDGRYMTATYPELAELVDCVDVDCVVDGEIVALGPSSRSDFGRLQQRMGLTKSRDVAREWSKPPVYLMVFDLLHS